MSVRTVVRLALPAIVALGVAGAVLPASAQSSTVIIAPSAPPAPRAETIPPPPGSGPQTVTWVEGHWTWNGTGWVWHNGHYVTRPAATAVWEPGHWKQRASGGYIWIAGHWQHG